MKLKQRMGAVLRPALAGAVLASALAACTTAAPVHYYTLVGPLPASAPAAAGFDIDVLPVVVAPGLRRRAMVLRTGTAELMVQDGHQWQAPLPDELRAALSADLVAALGTRDLSGLQPAGRPLYRIALVVQRFDAVYGGSVDVGATWSVYAADDTPLLTCAARVTRTVQKAGYAELAQGAQQALAAIAAQIGTALVALPQMVCPPVAPRIVGERAGH